MLEMPAPRGPLSATVRAALQGSADLPHDPAAVRVDDPLTDDDLHLALALCYELHYRGIAGIDERWEWDPSLLAFRRRLEEPFEAALRRAVEPISRPRGPRALSEWLVNLADDGSGPSLSRFLAREASLEQFREFVIHRSIYTLKEADPHSFVIPRLDGAAKSALLEIQADEYGGGDAGRMHSAIFARTMRALGLDPTYGAYLGAVPGVTLATVNLVGMLGLHRRLRGAAMGHLALFELTSAVPNRRYGNGLRRLGFDEQATDYYDEHVEADSVHDMIAAYDLVGALVDRDPAIGAEIMFGALALAHLERRFATALLQAWAEGRSSLFAVAGAGALLPV